MSAEKKQSAPLPVLQKKRPRINIFAVVLSVLMAISLWVYVLAVDSPTNEKSYAAVKIELTGMDTLSGVYGFSVLSGYDLTADVTLRGKRAELNRLSAADLRAFVNLSDITAAGSYQKQVQVSLPSGMDMVACSPSFVTVDVDMEKTVSVPVLEPQESYTLEEGVRFKRSYSVENITVKGPQAVLDRIKGIQPVLELGLLTESVTQTAPVRYVDAHGDEVQNRYLVPSQPSVSITYTLYKEKTVPLVLEIETKLPGESVTQSVNPAKITVQGAPDAIDELTEIYAKTISTADMKSDTNAYSGTVELPVGFESPAGSVSYTATTALQGVATTSFSMSVPGDGVRVTGAPAGFSYSFSAESITVTMRALSAWVDMVDASVLSATVNLSSYTKEGTYKVDLSFTVAQAQREICYVVSATSLEVTLVAA